MPEPSTSTTTRGMAPISDEAMQSLRALRAAADTAYEVAKEELGEIHPIVESLLEVWANADAIEKAAERENGRV